MPRELPHPEPIQDVIDHFSLYPFLLQEGNVGTLSMNIHFPF